MREMGILEKTWIIFTSDHGEMLGDHRMGAKSVFLEGSTHIPLIVRPPATDIDGVYKLEASQFRGRRISHLAQLTDIMPTILAAARVEIPEDIDGLDLMTFTTEQGANERIFIGECGDYQFAVMDKQFKYTVTAFGKEELLFDLVKDPMEQNNLAGKQEFCEIQQNLKTVLMTHLEKHNSRMFENGELKNKGTINSAADVARWPGLHSLHDESDLLH
jgi:arylsulfatase A-like enzyme